MAFDYENVTGMGPNESAPEQRWPRVDVDIADLLFRNSNLLGDKPLSVEQLGFPKFEVGDFSKNSGKLMTTTTVCADGKTGRTTHVTNDLSR
jgi:hypothetical protein